MKNLDKQSSNFDYAHEVYNNKFCDLNEKINAFKELHSKHNLK